jgi:hypothetical protein
MNAFDTYLHRYGDTKSKVMNQLLYTLLDRLSKNPNADTCNSIRKTCIQRLLRTIFSAESGPILKPSITALEHILRKGIFELEAFLEQTCLFIEELDLDSDWNKVSNREVSNYYTECIQHSKEDVKLSAELNTRPRCCFQSLFAAMLVNCFQTENILAAAKLFVTFLYLFETRYSFLGGIKSLTWHWARPLKSFLKMQPDFYMAFKTQIFPILFKQSPMRFSAFVAYCFSTQSGEMVDIPEETLRFLLFTLEAGKELGLTLEIGESSCHKYA